MLSPDVTTCDQCAGQSGRRRNRSRCHSIASASKYIVWPVEMVGVQTNLVRHLEMELDLSR